MAMAPHHDHWAYWRTTWRGFQGFGLGHHMVKWRLYIVVIVIGDNDVVDYDVLVALFINCHSTRLGWSTEARTAAAALASTETVITCSLVIILLVFEAVAACFLGCAADLNLYHRHNEERDGLPGVWCGVVWCGVVWCGVVWCGVVWCGVVWYGV
jgi:hypothetical protein